MNDLLKKIERNLYGKFAYFPSRLPNMEVQRGDDYILINSKMATSMFNIVCDLNIPKEDFSEIFQTITHDYQQLPFALWSPHKYYEKMNVENLMILDLDKYQPVKPKIEVHPNLKDFSQILELYDPYARPYFQLVSALGGNQSALFFVGYDNNQPVSIGSLFFSEDVAGIFDVLTLSAERGKGYGTAMMHFLLQYAKAKGYKYASLSASSDSGFRIYQRLGFETCGTMYVLERN